jgi:hypothetical protein
VGGAGHLEAIEELAGLAQVGDAVECPGADGGVRQFTGAEAVSMNFWGFTPEVFGILERQLTAFFHARGGELKSECFIPLSVGEMVSKGDATCAVLPTDSAWFGVTFREDKPVVQGAIQKLVEAGDYPSPLWS